MGRLIDIENIDYVRLEDSLHCLEHHKGDEVECVICAPTVEAISKADYEERLKVDMIAMLTEIKDAASNICSTIWNCDSFTEGIRAYDKLIQQKINALRGDDNDN